MHLGDLVLTDSLSHIRTAQKKNRSILSQAWWCTSLVLTLHIKKQENPELKASLSYKASLRPL